MARAILINEREWERDYQIPSRQIITLKLEDDWSQITFWGNGQQLGHDRDFIFEETESSNNSYLLARMYVPIKKQGLGRAAVEFFKDATDALIFCRPNDGIVRDDGSHLTDDAPGFVAKMIEEKLIEDNEPDDLTNENE